MGYSTEYKGILYFKNELMASEIAHLIKFLGEDIRDLGFTEEDVEGYWFHIQLEITDDYDGIQWNGSEKTTDMEHIINFITKQMRKQYSKFELTGELFAQGQEFGDVFKIVMQDGVAIRKEIIIEGNIIKCPECEKKFILKEEHYEKE